MSFLKTTCDRCGEIELPVARVLLRIDPTTSTRSCVVRCPHCGDRFLKEANEAMVALLLTVGIEVSMWTGRFGKASDSSEAESHTDGVSSTEPITHDDLVAFRELLRSDNYLLERFTER